MTGMKRMAATLLLSLGLWQLTSDVQATNLNDLFQLPIWQDSTLWDDDARAVARRLDLEGAENKGAAFFRRGLGGSRSCLGVPLYSIDLYSQEGKAQRLVLGFVNAADLNAQGVQMTPADFSKLKTEQRQAIVQRLSGRLGPAIENSGSWHWSWMGHGLKLQETSQALILSIEKAPYSPVANQSRRLIESGYQPFDPRGRVLRRPNGDVVITKIPPISQGNRNFCVPASWEKNLRYFGVALNVYELADSGGTEVQGSAYQRFASRITREISSLGFRVEYLRHAPDNLTELAQSIDAGLPVIWAMDAQLLPGWVAQSRARRDSLPPSPLRLPGPEKAYHAVLIIGYNARHNEVAISDSTELGHTTPEIWARAEEIKQCHVPSEPLIVLRPPNSLVAPSREFKKKIY
jgi:hypothetical protein